MPSIVALPLPSDMSLRWTPGESDMDHFIYQNGTLYAEDVPIPEIAASVGTPFYV